MPRKAKLRGMARGKRGRTSVHLSNTAAAGESENALPSSCTSPTETHVFSGWFTYHPLICCSVTVLCPRCLSRCLFPVSCLIPCSVAIRVSSQPGVSRSTDSARQAILCRSARFLSVQAGTTDCTQRVQIKNENPCALCSSTVDHRCVPSQTRSNRNRGSNADTRVQRVVHLPPINLLCPRRLSPLPPLICCVPVASPPRVASSPLFSGWFTYHPLTCCVPLAFPRRPPCCFPIAALLRCRAVYRCAAAHAVSPSPPPHCCVPVASSPSPSPLVPSQTRTRVFRGWFTYPPLICCVPVASSLPWWPYASIPSLGYRGQPILLVRQFSVAAPRFLRVASRKPQIAERAQIKNEKSVCSVFMYGRSTLLTSGGDYGASNLRVLATTRSLPTRSLPPFELCKVACDSFAAAKKNVTFGCAEFFCKESAETSVSYADRWEH